MVIFKDTASENPIMTPEDEHMQVYKYTPLSVLTGLRKRVHESGREMWWEDKVYIRRGRLDQKFMHA